MWESLAWATLPLLGMIVLAALGVSYSTPLRTTLLMLPFFGMNGIMAAFWYFAVGRSQSKYIVSHLNGAYVREGWIGPAFIALTPFAVLLATFA